jgi:hypothetical protein
MVYALEDESKEPSGGMSCHVVVTPAASQVRGGDFCRFPRRGYAAMHFHVHS